MNWRDYGGRGPGEVGLSAQKHRGRGEQKRKRLGRQKNEEGIREMKPQEKKDIY